ncbi:MAG TPA: hypothetical protein VJ801_00920 [Polyangia bacterium]|nr:hypothetical protein [Polyangia bacterium]
MIPVAALLLFAAPASAALADEATPVALAGDGEAVSAIEHSLANRKIRVVPSAGAETVQVRVQPDAAGIRLSIQDRNGHTVERIVANAEIAAAVVESWVRDDLARPLLEPHEIATPARAPTVSRSPVPARPRASSGASVTVAGTTSLASDGSLWTGAALGACVRVGRFCVGLEIQAAGDLATTGNIGARYVAATCDGSSASGVPHQRQLTRLGAEALLTADLPLRIGAGTLGPGIGLGAGWLSTIAVLDDQSANATTVGLRAETRILLSWPLAWGLAVDAGLWADVLPFAHRDTFTTGGFELPGEPLGFLRAQLGLRYGPLDRAR